MTRALRPYRVLLGMPNGCQSWVHRWECVSAASEQAAREQCLAKHEGCTVLCVISPDLDCQGVQRD